MENTKKIETGILMDLITRLYKKKKDVCKMCISNVTWKYNHIKGEGVRDGILAGILAKEHGGNEISLEFYDLKIVRITDQMGIIAGVYKVIDKKNLNNKKAMVYDVVLVITNKRAVYIQINGTEKKQTIHRVKANNEDYYAVSEDEILYIESLHNQVIWHCTYMKIILSDSLQHLEKVMSRDFVRIQRSYLVNKNHVKIVRRCEAVMDNEDILPIPTRKYVRIKETLMEII